MQDFKLHLDLHLTDFMISYCILKSEKPCSLISSLGSCEEDPYWFCFPDGDTEGSERFNYFQKIAQSGKDQMRVSPKLLSAETEHRTQY
jgi:hypothetical protein